MQRPPWRCWRRSHSDAIRQDLQQALLPLDSEEMTAFEAWVVYRQRPEFLDMPYPVFEYHLRLLRNEAREALRAMEVNVALGFDDVPN